jgi:hypothetical protein
MLANAAGIDHPFGTASSEESSVLALAHARNRPRRARSRDLLSENS